MFGHQNDPLTIQREAMSVEILLVQILSRDEYRTICFMLEKGYCTSIENGHCEVHASVYP